MNTRIRFLATFVVGAVFGALPAFADEVVLPHHQAAAIQSYDEFRRKLLDEVANEGQPVRASGPVATLPIAADGLATALAWGEIFPSAEPEKCPDATPRFEYSFEQTEIDTVNSGITEVDRCFYIDGARRKRSTLDPETCDQQNARYYACFKRQR